MTLEEVIAKCEERVEMLIESMNACDLDDTVEKLIARNDAKCADEHRQIAEWLKELIKRRKQPEIICCKDCRFNVSSHKCLHPESFFLVPDDDFYCGYAERRTDERRNNG